ncbi:MAG TPA: phosphoglycolate phosphatase [Caulobacteraceae bacterium]
MHDLDLTGAAIAFDLDGTLVDTAPDLVATLNLILEQEGLPPLPYDDGRRMISHGAKALIVKGFTAAGRPLDALRAETLTDRFVAHYLDRIADESRPFPGAVDALEILKAAGARLSVCTNKRTRLSEALLSALDLTRYFEAIVGPDSAPAPKPDPRHLLTAIERSGGRRSRALLVGDSETDISTAKNAGIPVVAVTFGYTEVPCADLNPDALIDHFGDLTAEVTRLLSR